MTFWPHKGTTEWVEYDFAEHPRKLTQSEVYWFDDEHAPRPGQCRTPASYRLLYRPTTGGDWKEVPNPSGHAVEKDHFNTSTFDPIDATAIRLEVKLRDGASAGILEWRVE
jgi:hypothetical protein